jgi:hypothetical protein
MVFLIGKELQPFRTPTMLVIVRPQKSPAATSFVTARVAATTRTRKPKKTIHHRGTETQRKPKKFS